MKYQIALLGLAISLGIVAFLSPASSLGADPAPEKTQQQIARAKWEDLVLFFGDEETGEWSLRLRDRDVKARGWFEYLELWQFNRTEKKWEQIKVEKFAKAIVLPKQKAADEPEDSQTLVELKEIEPKTAGLWWAKWKIDDVECGTLMRVGTAKADNKLTGRTPKGMVAMVVPIDLNKSEAMYVPDPRTYCIAGGPGKP